MVFLEECFRQGSKMQVDSRLSPMNAPVEFFQCVRGGAREEYGFEMWKKANRANGAPTGHNIIPPPLQRNREISTQSQIGLARSRDMMPATDASSRFAIRGVPQVMPRCAHSTKKSDQLTGLGEDPIDCSCKYCHLHP